MANQQVVIDVPYIAKKARDAGNPDQIVINVTLPDATKIDLVVFPFGAPRDTTQGGGAGSCNGICV